MTVDLATLYAATGEAKLADLPANEAQVRGGVPPGADVTLTGIGPVIVFDYNPL